MKDYIFVTGASGIGKTTLSNGLLAHYKTTCIEQHMVPEFISRDGEEPMTGELEELTCWENQVALLRCFHKLGYKNTTLQLMPTATLMPKQLFQYLCKDT